MAHYQVCHQQTIGDCNIITARAVNFAHRMRLDQWWSSGSPQWDPWITFSLFCNTGVFVAYELKSIIDVIFSQPFQKSPLPLPMHCWAGLTSQWLYSSAVGAGNFEKSWSDNDFSLCIVPTPPIWRPTAPHHSSPLPHCFAINTRFFVLARTCIIIE